MVTHGYVVFKYEGIYYIYDNYSDSYCDFLGKQVINNINVIIDNNYIKDYKKKLLRIPLRDEMSDMDNNFYTIYNAIDNYDTCAYYTSNKEPYNSYVYIIDFDKDEFIITKYGKRYTFNLFDIPQNWMEIVEKSEKYMYDNNEYVNNEKIKAKISELEEEIKQLKLKIKN